MPILFIVNKDFCFINNNTISCIKSKKDEFITHPFLLYCKLLADELDLKV